MYTNFFGSSLSLSSPFQTRLNRKNPNNKAQTTSPITTPQHNEQNPQMPVVHSNRNHSPNSYHSHLRPDFHAGSDPETPVRLRFRPISHHQLLCFLPFLHHETKHPDYRQKHQLRQIQIWRFYRHDFLQRNPYRRSCYR